MTREREARDEHVDRLLHDAEHKHNAATFAVTLMHDEPSARRFREERDSLIRMAHKIDPHHDAPAWQEPDELPLPEPAARVLNSSSPLSGSDHGSAGIPQGEQPR